MYWPGSLGYYVQGAIDETDTLRWYGAALNAASRTMRRRSRRRMRSLLTLHDLIAHRLVQILWGVHRGG